MTGDNEKARARGRDDLTRVIYQQGQKDGQEISYREAELKARERADLLDKKKDWGEK